MQITITESLAEIKTIQKRITAKEQFVRQYLGRDERIRDPLESKGGSAQEVAKELQSIKDLRERLITIRHKIQEANHRITISLDGDNRTISAWLTWRKEVAPGQQNFLSTLVTGVNQIRKEAQSKGMTVGVGANVKVGETDTHQVLVNVDERSISIDLEKVQTMLGQLDGQLSLKNATSTIELD